MIRTVGIILLLLNSYILRAQPYNITAYIDSTVIKHDDVSSLQSITYSGQGMNWVYDRRVEDWLFINTYLFDVIYDDGITSQVQVNPEFGSVAAATVEAEKYAFIIGQLPACLRIGVNKIWIHLGTESFGGGFNAVLIHVGQSTSYEQLGILEEVLAHEAVHTALDPAHAMSSGWTNSQNLDGGFISTYAASSPNVEDLAESFLTWIMVRQCNRRIAAVDSITISQTIPNRLSYLDSQNFNMYPLCIYMSVSGINNLEIKNYDISIYPNPTTGVLNIKPTAFLRSSIYFVYDSTGKVLLKSGIIDENKVVNITDLSTGIYLLIIGEEEKQTFKVIKQ